MAPITAAVPKALLPLPDHSGAVRAVVHWIVREALSVARRACVVASAGHLPMLQAYFAAAAEHDALLRSRVDLLVQPSPAGFGDAIRCARERISQGRFMVLLGDHVHIGAPGAAPCAVQVAQAAATLGDAVAVVGMQAVDESQIGLVGVARGESFGAGLYRCADFVEKPDVATARRRLVTGGLPRGQYLAHNGIFIFDTQMLQCLDQVAAAAHGEVSLAAAQSLLLCRGGRRYYLHCPRGRSHDTGTPPNYISTWDAFRAAACQPPGVDARTTF
jgi:UTP--glucose-1-phosphate uridylyltransferase